MAAYLIGITGGSGSGKTTLAQALCAHFGPARALHLSEDHYYRPRSELHPEAAQWSDAQLEAEIDFDDPAAKDLDLLETHLSALARGEGVVRPYYSFERHDRIADSGVRTDPKPVIIAEGIHVLASAGLRRVFDLAIFVDASDERRFTRRLKRDVDERGRTPQSVRAQYTHYVRPAYERYTAPAKDHCDLLVEDLSDDPIGAAERLIRPVIAYMSKTAVRAG